MHTFAEIVDVHPYTVKRWVKAGVIPSALVGRVVLIDVERALKALSKFERKEVAP
jgi:hypothetical protein